MELIRGLHNLRPRHRGCVATIGNFDGVHKGHQQLLAQIRSQAERRGLPTVAVTFEPQPQEFFSPAAAPPRLTSLRSKALRLAEAGGARLLVLRFDEGLRCMSTEAFIDGLLVSGLGVRHLVIGDDFRFGAGRSGDFATLQAAGQVQGFTVAATPSFLLGGERVSSTRVRGLLEDNALDAAERLLGWRYTMCGRVIPGEQLGRKLGVPTANIGITGRPPLEGVYAADVRFGGRWHPAVASVGTRPTVDGTRPVLEVHVLDYSDNLYGERLEVRFAAWLRGQTKFPDIDALRRAMEADIHAARDHFRGRMAQSDSDNSTLRT